MQRSRDEQMRLLQQTRRTRVPDWSLASTLERESERLRKIERSRRGAGGAWNRVVPSELRGLCEVVGVSRGVLRVRVSDPSARYALDRWLQGGGLQLILRESPRGVTSVRLQTGRSG